MLPDLVQALKAVGGMLLVPTDASLEAALNSSSGPGDWMADAPLLRQLLARHTILISSQMVSLTPDTGRLQRPCNQQAKPCDGVLWLCWR